MMQMVDTHCHIHSTDYPLDVAEVMVAAANANITTLLCVGTSADDSEVAVQFVQDKPNCYATVGLHPHDAKLSQPAFDKLTKLVAEGQKIVGIGECGLDYFYNHSSPAEQEKALRMQIELALANKLPLVFHVREAFDDFWPIFAEYPDIRGVLHSFTDSIENLDRALEAGLYIGVNGIATFTKNDWQLQMYRHIPLDQLLLETDAPFLTPAPFRGKINEPKQIRRVCEFLSELRQEPIETIATRSTHNARTLFGL